MLHRMSQDDRERYGGPEWLDFATATEWLEDCDYDALDGIEQEIRGLLGKEVTLLSVLGQIMRSDREASSVPMLRVQLWLCLRASGVDVPLADFKPKAFHLERSDADPPSDGAEPSAISDETTPPASETSTSASTPGSPEATTA